MEARDNRRYQEIFSTFSEEVLSPTLNTLRCVRRWGLAVGGAASLTLLIAACTPDAPRIPTATPIDVPTSTPKTIVIETPTATPTIDLSPTTIPTPRETTLPLPSPSPSPQAGAERAAATPTLTAEAKEKQRIADISEMRDMFSTYAKAAPNRDQVIEELNRIERLNYEDAKKFLMTVHTGYTNNRKGSFTQIILLDPSKRAKKEKEDVMHVIKDHDLAGKVKTRIMKINYASPIETLGAEFLAEFEQKNNTYIQSSDEKDIIVQQFGNKLIIIEQYDKKADIPAGWIM